MTRMIDSGWPSDAAADRLHFSRDETRAFLRQDLTSFIVRSFYELNPGRTVTVAPYIRLLATKLEAVRRGEIKRLIVNLPPRRLKSHCASVAFPAWVLGHDRRKRVLCISYGQSLADEFADACRSLMCSRSYRSLFGGVLINPRSSSDLRTEAGGGRLASSVGGALTGRGADLVIIDDPQKADDALFETDRKRVQLWYDQVLFSRLDSLSDSAIIVVMQRLCEDDLVAHVLKHGNWDVLALPIIAQRQERYVIDSPFGPRHFTREPGDFLDPLRDDEATIAAIRSSMSEEAFASQYLQDPSLPAQMRARRAERDRGFSEALRSGNPLEIGRAWRARHVLTEEVSISDEEAMDAYREFAAIVEELEQKI